MNTFSIFSFSLRRLNRRILAPLACCSLSAISLAQEVVAPPQTGEIVSPGYREVIKQAVIRKEEHSVTVREVVPPSSVVKPKPVPSVVRPDDQKEALPGRFMMVGVTLFDEKPTFLEWHMGGERFSAWSPANFKHLDGLVEFEDRGFRYSIMCLVTKGSVPEGAVAEMSERSKLIVAGPTADSLVNQPLLVSGSRSNAPSMDFLYGLHDYYNSNREKLAQVYEAKLLERKLNPPKPAAPAPKKDSTVTYWKYHKPTAKAK